MSACVSAVVAVNQNPQGHRRTREVIATLHRVGWTVTVASPSSHEGGESHQHIKIGSDWVTRLLGRAFGPVTRNLTRVAFSLVTLLPTALARPALSGIAHRVLRLGGLVAALRDGADIIVVEDVLLLPVVLHHRGAARVVFDAREFFPRQFEHSRVWRWSIGHGMRRMLRLLLPDCDAVTTVSEGLRAGYRDLAGIDAMVTLNVPPLTPADSSVRNEPADEIGVNQPPLLRAVFHGLANPNRGLQALVEVGRALEGRATLDLYLTGPKRHRRAVARAARGATNVCVLEPVPFGDVPSMLSSYDIGCILYDGSTFNLRHAMPSKFFDYLHAGLPVAIGPSPDMSSVVRRYDCGVVAADFTPEALAHALSNVSDARLEALRTNACNAAKQLSAEVEYRQFEALLRGLAP